MAFSPEAGLNISATVVVGAGRVVEVAATLALVESVELLAPPHDARPATRSAVMILFMTLVYTTMAFTKIPNSET